MNQIFVFVSRGQLMLVSEIEIVIIDTNSMNNGLGFLLKTRCWNFLDTWHLWWILMIFWNMLKMEFFIWQNWILWYQAVMFQFFNFLRKLNKCKTGGKWNLQLRIFFLNTHLTFLRTFIFLGILSELKNYYFLKIIKKHKKIK